MKPKINLLTGDFYKIKSQFIRKKYDFITTESSTIKKIETPGKVFIIGTPSDRKTFVFYNILKKEVRQSGIIPGANYEGQINYFARAAINKTVFKNCVNVDINSAYINSLFNLGYIEKPILEQFLSIDKFTRLWSFGALASQKIQTSYNDGLQIGNPVKLSDPVLRSVFFEASKKVDQCMIDLMEFLTPWFLCYWVDGIYLRKGFPENILKEIMNEYNFTYKTEYMNSLKVIPGKRFTFVVTDSGKGLKSFYFPNRLSGYDEKK